MRNALNRSQAAENKFRLLVEQACEVLILRDKNGKINYVSPRILSLFGYKPDEFIKQPLSRLFMAESLLCYQDAINDVLNEPGTSKPVKLEYIHKDGSIKWLEGTIFNHLDEPGIHAIVSSFRDITERIEIEKQKDSFIGIVSHELKTPLTSIKAYLQLIQAKAALVQEPFFMQALQKVNHQLNTMTRMINTFLNLPRLESGKLELNKQAFDLNELVEEIVVECQFITTHHEIQFQSKGPQMISADRDKISSVLINLISNAEKYAPLGKVIQVRTFSTNDEVGFSVQDQGIGIKLEDKERLFDRYFRLVTEQSKNVSGFGIGLYISQEIVRLHQGYISIDSIPGEGSTFSVHLPSRILDK